MGVHINVETSFSLIKNETEELSQQKQSLEFKISNTNQKLSQINVAINNLSNAQTQLQAYKNLLNQPVYTGLASLPIDYSLSAPEYLKEYNDLYTKVNYLKNLIDKESSILTKSENDLLVLKEKNISGKDLLTLSECENLIDNLSINQIYNSFYLPIIHNIYIKHNEQYSKKYYHHKLYTLLLLCYLYYGQTTLNHNFINIDEAQDMSYAEYNLLKGVLGEKCTFNLYGDVNQAIYSYRSIEDWEEIVEAFNGIFYLLNENYRNTEQITSYCNKTLYSDLKPIGISGPKVKEYYNLQDGIDWIKQYQKNHPKHRCVIITIFNSLNMPNEIQNILKTSNIHWYAGNNNSVSIAKVETVKGLEFECVLALTDSMNDNEKYITFTRALSCLAVVNKNYKTLL